MPYSFTAAAVVFPASSHGPSGSILANSLSTRGSTSSRKASARGANSACGSLRNMVVLPHTASNAGTASRHTSYNAWACAAFFPSTPSNSHGLAVAVHRTLPVLASTHTSRFGSAVVNTRSPATVGWLFAHDGISVFHTTFFVLRSVSTGSSTALFFSHPTVPSRHSVTGVAPGKWPLPSPRNPTGRSADG